MPVATSPPVAHVAAASPLGHAIVRRINAVRARHGEHPVVLTARLRRLARHHTLDMLRHDRFSHDGDGTTFSQRIRARVHYRKVGETLATMPRRTSSGPGRMRVPVQTTSACQISRNPTIPIAGAR